MDQTLKNSAGHEAHSSGSEKEASARRQNTRAVVNRLSRAIGHLEMVRRMVEDERDCNDILIQLAAVRSALQNTGKVILKDHLEHCINDAVLHGDPDAIDALNRAIDQFMK